MGMVVLDACLLDSLQIQGIFGGQVVGVEVISNQARFYPEKFLIQLEGTLKMLEGLPVFQIPDVLAEESIVFFGQAEGVFQLRSAGQSLDGREGQRKGIGSIASGSSHQNFLAIYHSDYRIIIASINVPVMEEEVISNSLQSF
jgi:hypothetical protein